MDGSGRISGLFRSLSWRVTDRNKTDRAAYKAIMKTTKPLVLCGLTSALLFAGCAHERRERREATIAASAGAAAGAAAARNADDAPRVVYASPPQSPGAYQVQQVPPMPAPIPEAPTTQPSSDTTWVPGYYSYNGNGYTWVSGHWEAPPTGTHVFVSPHWEQRNGSYVFVPGYWQ